MTPEMTQRLQQDVSAVCPNTGVSIREPDPVNPDPPFPPDYVPVTEQQITVFYADTATQPQKDAADVVVANFDQSQAAQDAWELEASDELSKGHQSKQSADARWTKAMDRQIHDWVKDIAKKHNNIAPANQKVTEYNWQETVDLAEAWIDSHQQ